MPAQRQINSQSHTAHLVEVRDADGTVYPSTAVDPGESIDWPQPIAGFSGWDWEAHYAAEAAALGLAVEPESSAEAGSSAEAAAPAKSRSKASVKATDATPEATA